MPGLHRADIRVKPIQNWVPNPSFETNITSWNNNAGTIARVASGGLFGTSFLRWTATSTSATRTYTATTLSSYNRTTVPHGKYVVQAWVRPSTTNILVDLTAAGGWGTNPRTTSISYPANVWSLITLKIDTNSVTGAPGFGPYLYVTNRTTGDTLDIDGVMVYEGVEKISSADGANAQWKWLGTAHGSRSVGYPTILS